MRKPSYADVVRTKMKSRDNQVGEPMTLRQLSELTGYSYEHLRKIALGEPVVSKELNVLLCNILKLNESEMWAIARTEKMLRKYGADAVVPPESNISRLWSQLTDHDKDRVAKFIEGLALSGETTA